MRVAAIPPGQAKGDCEERNERFGIHDIVSFLVIVDDGYSLQFYAGFVPYRRIGCEGRLNRK